MKVEKEHGNGHPKHPPKAHKDDQPNHPLEDDKTLEAGSQSSGMSQRSSKYHWLTSYTNPVKMHILSSVSFWWLSRQAILAQLAFLSISRS